MIRAWLRSWLGITKTEARVVLLQGSVDGVNQMVTSLSEKHSEINAVLAEIRGLREQLQDTKARVVVARTSTQFRKLMEVDQ